ncbi:MAG: hypothetical protein L6R40_005277 [Gallowayella cf. fulva]|nr:MAG: hypothetical protein L6R40_005277 [Xanthomendoza cf. fulva]
MALKPIFLDGRTLEGGGQLLRLAVSLSALTYLPVHIYDIRANRAPRKASQPAGGLKAAHLAAVEWLAKATQANTEGMVKGSRNLDFQPLQLTHFIPKKHLQSSVWQHVYSGTQVTRRETRIELDSPGSVCLILQAILPYLLFHSARLADPAEELATADTGAASVPLRVTINGGTNVSKSPSIEYIRQVLIPLLVDKVGIPPITTHVIKRGWNSGRADVGTVQFDLIPFAAGSRMSQFHFTDRGEVTRMHVSILAADSSARNTLRKKVIERLLARHPDVEILFPIEEDTNNSARLYLLVVAETSRGYRLGRDCLWERKGNLSTLETVANKVTKELEEELQRGGCVDEYMQDQLVVFQALADGTSVVDSGNELHATLHTKTARWVTERLLGLNFNEKGTCGGCGFEVGEDYTKRAVQDSADELERLRIS